MEKNKNNPIIKEGDLYKVINTFGKTFELYYGYYEEQDRYGKYNEPIEIYPDFRKNPIYTDDGLPFVTAMQDTCEHYIKIKDTTDRCIDCKYYQKGEELFGLCKCKARYKKNYKDKGEKL
jgi:hypothetical protein